MHRAIVIGFVASLVGGCDGGSKSSGDASTEPDVAEDSSAEMDVAAEDGGTGTTWTLTGEGIEIVVHEDPFSFDVISDGETVLSSLGAGTGDGYGALAWTSGELTWDHIIYPGYTDFTATLDPWRDDYVVESVTENTDSLGVVLAPRDATGGEPNVQVTMTLRPSTLRVQAAVTDGTPRAWASAFHCPTDEAFMGFGERFTRTNLRGVDVYSWPEEGGVGEGEGSVPGPENPGPNGEAQTYYPVPFFVSSEGYGAWLDSTWRNEFNLATDDEDSWRVWHIGPEIAYEIYVPVPTDDRPWPFHLVDLFTATVGRPMLPPAWTFGPRRRIGRNDMQGSVSEIQAMRDLDLAITGIDDSVHFLPRGVHVGLESELEDWVNSAATLGYRVNCYFNPYLSVATDSGIRSTYLDGLDNGYYIMGPGTDPEEVFLISGVPVFVNTVDFSNPDATTWYHSMLQWALDLGYSGWMYDFGEYVQPDSVAFNGMTGEEYANLYPVLYMKAAHDYLESGPMAGDWLSFARSGYTGASQYTPMVWSGDPNASFCEADGLPSMIPAGVNMGISGVPNWGGDINGFHCSDAHPDAADEELLVRWIQQGSMTPNMQDQDACALATTATKESIFSSMAGQEAWRTYARLHTRLFPYLYTLSHEATATGAPLMRNIFFEHPDRVDLASVKDSYYLGPALFVAPVVVRGETVKTVDLPAGYYLDWHDETLLTGGDTVTLPAPLAKLPLLLRDGYIVPLLDPTIDTLASETHPEVMGPADVSYFYDVVGLVSTDTGAASFTLYDDDTFSVTWTGDFTAPAGYTAETSDVDLATCATCYMVEDLDTGFTRVRINGPAGEVTAGGLTLSSTTDRTVRWDLYLVQ